MKSLLYVGDLADGPLVKCKLHARHQSKHVPKQPRYKSRAKPHIFPPDSVWRSHVFLMSSEIVTNNSSRLRFLRTQLAEPT